MSVKLKSVKFMSVNDKVRQKYWSISFSQFKGFSTSRHSDLRSVDNCLKMTAHDGKLVAMNQEKHS